MKALGSKSMLRTTKMTRNDEDMRPVRRRRAAGLTAALASAALLAACGSSGGSGGGSSAGSSGSATAGGTSSGGPGAISVGNIPGYKPILETGGQPVYVLSTDPSGSSKCNGGCSKTWKPVTVSGKPSAGSGADSSMLSTFKRSDGTTQVLYNKHALYTHAGSASQNAGTASDGGVWYLINAKGAFVKSTSSGGY
jgi:predicted lipoprotein with Yx(FWY)xxD motif